MRWALTKGEGQGRKKGEPIPPGLVGHDLAGGLPFSVSVLAIWPEVCAVVEAAGEYRQSVMDDAGSYEEGQRWVEAGKALDAAWAALARRMDEEGL